MPKKSLSVLLAVILLAMSGTLEAQDGTATLRKGAPLSEQPAAPVMSKVSNQDLRRARNYPEQPPTIPHKIDGYQVDLNSNRCLACHNRRRTEETQAPMVSVTHYMDRDGNFLAEVSTRRYFCNQCHVIQTSATPLVDNTFEDIDEILRKRLQNQ